MKIIEFKIEVVTIEKRYTTIHDPEAINADEDGEIQLSYDARLKNPEIRPILKIKIEEGEKELIPGGIYILPSCPVHFYAIDKFVLQQTEHKSYPPEEFSFSIEGEPVLIAQSFKEGR